MSSSELRKKVLIVDDESNVRDSLQMILSRTYAVEIADSGDKALGVLTDLAAKDQGTAVEEEEAREFPDLVLLDVMMPGIDGLGILEQIRSQYPRLPVIMLTASKAVKTAVQAFVTAYNDLAKNIAEQTKYDATTKIGGPLQGDSAVNGLLRQLREVINAPSGASSSFPRLSDIGLSMQRDGTLSVDSAKLDAATLNLPELKKAFANNDTGNAANVGFARRYANLATQVLGVDGSLTTRTEGLRERLVRNSSEQEQISARIDRYQQRLVAQYTAMDANLAKLNSLSSYLTQQIAALTKSNSSDS